MEYKETLLMPKTEFSMRGNLPENEKLMRDRWDEMDLYHLILKKNEGNKPFILHDGPPYANANIHIGHAMNKILKDFVNRYRMMEGDYVTFIPGWDTHGLPIETAVTNSGVDRKSMGKAEFRELCLNYAKEQVAKQMADFKNLNVIADWDNPYITYQYEFEARQIEVFAEMARKGLIFKGLKPVYWSPSSESALAEAEIEYKDRTDSSIFLAFQVVEGNDLVNKGDYLVIWTTTPWTIPENSGIAVGEEFEYSKVSCNGKNYILATDLVESLAKDFGFEDYKIESTFKGPELVGVKYKHVFSDRVSPVVIGFHVTLEAGSGLVHMAPLYGADDYQIGKENNLEMIDGVDDTGHLTSGAGEEFKGLFFEDANKVVIEKLKEQGSLLCERKITHSYPHDWRTKKPIIFRATAQWFCSIDPIREQLLNELENNVKFHTPWGKTRLYNMIHDRGDWCISRQRVWGVPIPIFYNEDGSEIVDYDVMMHIAKLFREHGSNIWFSKTAKELLPEGYTNPASPNGEFTKEEDIMDVWFDSGSSHTGVLLERGMNYPADVYLEGSDQYRGWFNSSLICGVAVHGKAPYKELISHGFTLDGKGNKMSKSLGNTIDPNKVVKAHGSDILRWWVASTDFTEDVRISDELLNQVKESYRKLRNTYRFMLGNISDFNLENSISYDDMPCYDQYMMVNLQDFIKNTKKQFENYNYQEVYKLVNNYMFNLSNFYLDFTKDILYIEKQDSKVRRSVQTVLYNITYSLVRLLAPILPYTSEEVYQFLPNHKESVHLENNPEIVSYENEEEVKEMFTKFFKIKDDVYKALEEARNEKLIGKSLEAKVTLKVEDKEFVEYFKPYFKQLFIVSKVDLTSEDLTQYENCQVKVEPFVGCKCERCWNLYEETEMHDDICDRCYNVLEK